VGVGWGRVFWRGDDVVGREGEAGGGGETGVVEGVRAGFEARLSAGLSGVKVR
jgi:hypothetical protein